MARRPERSLAELIAAAKADPKSLSAAEVKRLRAELKRRGIGGGRANYEQIKEEARARRAEASRQGRDIGELPPVANPGRKTAGLAQLRTYCETYFPRRFRLAWSANHLDVIDKLQRVIVDGGREVKAVERGFGKTSLLEVATLWAVSRGHPYALLIGASKPAGLEMLESIKVELEENDLLAADFPEICHPIICLDGIANRCAGQLYRGQRTRISITKEEIVLPTIPGSPASGAVIRVVGILGRVRGRKRRLARPSLVLLDDPQTDMSAKSLSQTEKREAIINGAVLGLAGPDKQIAVLMAGTVIKRGDLMDRFLAPDRHLDWIKTRHKMLVEFPANMRRWSEYWTLRSDEIRNGGDGSQATRFYRDRQVEMDAGAVVSWTQRFKPGEISAVQHAMNLYFADPEAFAAEYQNEPLDAALAGDQLVAGEIAQRVSGIERRVVPAGATRLTAFIDVHKALLYYAVCAWADDFTGQVVDYGVWPDQGRAYFTLADAQLTIQQQLRGGLQAQILHALSTCSGDLLGREWRREDGAALKVGRLLVDANWGEATDTVYLFARRSPHAALIHPAHGKFVGAKSKPWHLYERREGQRLGLHWLIAPLAGRTQPAVTTDVNWWKTFVRERLQTAVGDRGALTLFGRPGQADHRLLGDHLVAEYGVQVSAHGRTVVEWSWRPERNDNHWLDCVVGCAVGASIEGAVLLESRAGGGVVTLSKMPRRRHGRNADDGSEPD